MNTAEIAVIALATIWIALMVLALRAWRKASAAVAAASAAEASYRAMCPKFRDSEAR